jgi:hypothetical protein
MAGGHWGGTLADELVCRLLTRCWCRYRTAWIRSPLPADNVSDAYRHGAPFLPKLLAEVPTQRC